MKVPILDLNFYSRVYDNFIEPEMCKEYINLFENTLKEEMNKVKDFNLCYDKQGNKICTQCSCQRVNTMQHDRFKDINKLMLPKFQLAVEKYKKDLNIHEIQFPKKFGWEEFKIKRYLAGDGGDDNEQFKYHVDVTNHASAKRFLILMVYLNDDFKEGETIFPVFGDVVVPKTGRLLIFPPYWTYLHAGKPPIKPGYAKYFLGTYLTYL